MYVKQGIDETKSCADVKNGNITAADLDLVKAYEVDPFGFCRNLLKDGHYTCWIATIFMGARSAGYEAVYGHCLVLFPKQNTYTCVICHIKKQTNASNGLTTQNATQ